MNDHSSSGRAGGLGGFLSKLLWGGKSSACGPRAEVASEAPAPLAFESQAESEYRDTGTVDAETLSEIYGHLERRKKIEAIKVYRVAARCGLKEAKEAVERLERKRAA